MPLRLIQMLSSSSRREEAGELLADFDPVALWHEQLTDGQALLNVLLPAEQVEDVLDSLRDRFGGEEGFRIVLLPVEATVPKHEPEEEEEGKSPEGQEAEKGRVSRQELYEDIVPPALLNGPYMGMILLSSLVAALGLWRGNIAIVIGAMVITPLLGPNMALALANTLGDTELLHRALRANLAGIGAGFALAAVIGVLLPFGNASEELLWGTRVGLPDIAVGLAAGGAGALAVTRGERSALVGVMVAVALLPPLVAAGLMVGAGQWSAALNAGTLFLVNVICVNLAGIAMFLLQGIWPHHYYEAQEAKKATRRALTVWLFLLACLGAAIVLSQ